jgi:hypothetical protein
MSDRIDVGALHLKEDLPLLYAKLDPAMGLRKLLA